MEVVIHNARIYGIDQSGSDEPVSLAIRDGIIIHVAPSSSDGLRDFLKCSNAKQFDLGGRSILPSFFDAHVHLLQFSISLSKFDLGGCKSLEEVRAAISQAAQAQPDAKRLLFHRWKQGSTGLDISATLIDDLDHRPIYIDSFDLHSAWCNTAALAELNVPQEDIPGGTIHRDSKGNPTGLLEESAVISLVWPFLSELLSREEKLDHLRNAIRVYNTAGYTNVIDMAISDEYWDLLVELHENGKLNIGFAGHFLVLPKGSEEETKAQVQRAIDLHSVFNLSNSPDFRIAGIKIVCDGVVDACTAAISKPYLGNKEPAEPMWTLDTLKPVVKMADEAGLQCALHAIGDDAVTMAIDSLESLETRGNRHRIEHLELTKPEDAKRLGRLGITASIQPVHYDPHQQSAEWPSLVGDELCTRAFAYRDFHDHGAKLAIGTDVPTAPHPPWNNLFNAVTRRAYYDPQNEKTMNHHFRLELADALHAASLGAAYSCFAEENVGSLEVGKQADFVVLDSKPNWKKDPVSLLSCKVTSTWRKGELVFGDVADLEAKAEETHMATHRL